MMTYNRLVSTSYLFIGLDFENKNLMFTKKYAFLAKKIYIEDTLLQVPSRYKARLPGWLME